MDVNPYTTPRETQADSAPQPASLPLKDPRPLGYLSCLFYILTKLKPLASGILFPEAASSRPQYFVFLALGFITVVLFLCWKHLAAWNARQLDPSQMSISPGKAAGGYFIPVANLVIPFRAMCGIARASIGKGADGLVIIWWALVLTLLIIPGYVSIFSTSPLTESGLVLFDIIWKVFSVLSWILLIVGVSLVIRITRAQADRREQVKASA